MSEKVDVRFGELAVSCGFLTDRELETQRAARAATAPTVPLEQWLRERGALTAAQCAQVARAYQEEARANPTDAASGAGGSAGRGGNRLGRYLLLQELGRGGMGVVYRAEDTVLKREVAVKTVRIGEGVVPHLVERLFREARTAAALEHPGIVPIHDIGMSDGVPYIAMAFVGGRNLNELMKDGAPAGLRPRVEIVHAVAEAVAHAHERQVVHRDLKPANVRIDELGRVRVMDLGLAKSLVDDDPLTDTREVLGTPKYMAPERLDGTKEPAGPAGDVYSLGVILYEMLTDRAPYQAANLVELLARVLEGKPSPPRSIDPTVPESLERICLKAMARRPKDRYPTAREMAADLGRWLEPGPRAAAAATAGSASKLAGWGWLAAVLIAAAILALGIALGKAGRSGNPADGAKSQPK